MPEKADRRLAAILAADVVEYSRLMGIDEEGTLAALKRYRSEVIDPKIAENRGRIVKTTGDGLLVEFPSVVDALRCATEAQVAVRELNADVPNERRIVFRIGINLGDVIVEDDDIFGDGVNVASRLEGVAEPGGICVSKSARDLVRDKLPTRFADLGDIEVKNIARSVRAYRVVFEPTQTGGTHRQAERSIAVLPFTNMSPDPDNEFFSDGVSEELINRLTKLPQLRVASRTSSFSFKGKNINVRSIADELVVDTILEGSVRRVDDRIRVTAQLIDAPTDHHLWSETYDRELKDIFAVQDEISHKIVEALEITLTPREKQVIEKAPTDVAGYDFYLRGRQALYQMSARSLESARALFSRAVEIDPEYAPAYAGIADCAAQLYMFFDKNEAHLDEAEAASQKAIELDSELAEAHASRGYVFSLKGRFNEAKREFDAAIRLDPKLYEGYYFAARDAFSQGKFERAAEMFEKAIEVRPEDYQAQLLVAQVYRSLGEEEKRQRAMRRGADIAAKHLKLNPDDSRALVLGATALAELGQMERAIEWGDRALAIAPDPSVLYNLASMYARIGEIEKALDVVEESARLGGGAVSKAWLLQDSDMDPLRDHPRFQAMLERLE